MGRGFLQLILASNRRKNRIPFVIMTTQTILEVITFFPYLSVVNDGLQQKKLMMAQDYHPGTLIGMSVQHLLEVWKTLISKSPLTHFSKAMAPYMLFKNRPCQLQVSDTVPRSCHRWRSGRKW